MSGNEENTPAPPMEKGNNIPDEEEENALPVEEECLALKNSTILDDGGHTVDVGNAGTYSWIPVFLVVPHVKSANALFSSAHTNMA